MKLFKKIVLIPLIAIAFLSFNNSCNKESDEKVVESVIKPPLPNIDISYTNYSIDAQKDTVLLYKTGSKITIPKNAFLDSEGKVIKGKVDIQYREFSNAFDIYLGGIPMQYDSDGTAQVFETAGMFEIKATLNNKAVYVNPDNKIQVDMVSFEQGNQYNLYQLDEVTGKWSDIGKDEITQINYEDELAQLPQIPPEPKKAGISSFSISDGTGKYPELAMYENVLFEPVDGKSCGIQSTDIVVKKMNNGKYEVTFSFIYNGKLIEEAKCICYLAFKEGVDYDNAMIIYQNKYATRIAKRKKMKKKIDDEWEKYFNIRKIYAEAGMLNFFNIEQIKNLKGEDKIIRSLSINNFGFINIDYPSDYPNGAELIAQFKDEKGNAIKLESTVLMVKGRNALFRYKNKIKFNPSKDNLLWGITEDGELAYFNSDDFKNVKATTGNYTFSMRIHTEKLNTYEDVVGVLFK